MRLAILLLLAAFPGAVPAAAQTVDPADRQSVITFYYGDYLGTQGSASGWNGNVASCQEGTVSATYLDAALRRVNYFRAMCGLPPVGGLDTTATAKCQKAALMMSANNTLSHSPPASWTCYSADGAEAASKSNLALGYSSLAAAITAWIHDGGVPSLGHRRWVLYPPLDETGFGAITGGTRTYAMWVLGPFGTRPASPEWVAWPPAGFVPYDLVPDMWSFSYPGANFSGASVTMSRNGSPITVALGTIQNGYGDNALSWTPQGAAPGAGQDVVYQVTVRNVSISGASRDFTYTVTSIDPTLTPARPTTWGSLKARYRNGESAP